jgi:hypothetical protein
MHMVKLRFGGPEAVGAGIGAIVGTLALAFTGPLALGGLLVGFALGWAVGWAIGRMCARVRRWGRFRFTRR